MTEAGLDATRSHVARMYDYDLGGKDNFAVDREAVVAVEAAMPEVRQLARENRAFLRRAVMYMTARGVHTAITAVGGGNTCGRQTGGSTHSNRRFRERGRSGRQLPGLESCFCGRLSRTSEILI